VRVFERESIIYGRDQKRLCIRDEYVKKLESERVFKRELKEMDREYRKALIIYQCKKTLF
jgi:hypothetical protein